MVLMIRDIWLTETPTIAGPISLSTRQTPRSCRLMRGKTNMPIFFKCGN